MAYNPPKRPIALLYFREAYRCGFMKFELTCLHCRRKVRRPIKAAAITYDVLLLRDYEARAFCRGCGKKQGYLEFLPGRVRPGAQIRWWLPYGGCVK